MLIPKYFDSKKIQIHKPLGSVSIGASAPVHVDNHPTLIGGIASKR